LREVESDCRYLSHRLFRDRALAPDPDRGDVFASGFRVRVFGALRNDEMLAVSDRLSYAVAMSKRLAATACLVLLGLSLGACTKCGWLWDQSPRSCHSDAPRM